MSILKTKLFLRYTWVLIGGGSLVLGGLCVWSLRAPPEPEYSGKRLSVWADEVFKLDRLSNIVNNNASAVRAVRIIGTNAIPWSLHELTVARPWNWRLNDLLQKQRIVRYRFSATNFFENRPLRARSVFWALGDIAEPAIPGLLAILEKQPELAPSALAGIGNRALPALEYCLTNPPPAGADRQHAKWWQARWQDYMLR